MIKTWKCIVISFLLLILSCGMIFAKDQKVETILVSQGEEVEASPENSVLVYGALLGLNTAFYSQMNSKFPEELKKVKNSGLGGNIHFTALPGTRYIMEYLDYRERWNSQYPFST